MSKTESSSPIIVGSGTANIAEDAIFGKNVIVYAGATIAPGVTIGSNCVIMPGNYIASSQIEENCTIGLNNYITGCSIGANVKVGNNNTIISCTISGQCSLKNNNNITSSVLEVSSSLQCGNTINQSVICSGANIDSSHIDSSSVGKGCSVGPFARLRPNSKLAENVKVGNFCEIKNSLVGSGSKISHLAYVGDASIGKNCNIGCGVIFANYNGKIKSKICLQDNCFIGSNVNLIAPLVVGEGSYICAGTTVTHSTNADDFVIGRVRQIVKPNYPKP